MERALDVDLVGELRVALSPCREKGGEVEDDLDLVMGGDLVEQVAVHDVARVRLEAETAIFLGQRRQVDRDDTVAPVRMHALEQRATDLSVGSSDEDDRFAHRPRQGSTISGSQ